MRSCSYSQTWWRVSTMPEISSGAVALLNASAACRNWLMPASTSDTTAISEFSSDSARMPRLCLRRRASRSPAPSASSAPWGAPSTQSRGTVCRTPFSRNWTANIPPSSAITRASLAFLLLTFPLALKWAKTTSPTLTSVGSALAAPTSTSAPSSWGYSKAAPRCKRLSNTSTHSAAMTRALTSASNCAPLGSGFRSRGGSEP
mmetsp:Transcript_14338/g.37849  ORF Transcript_14338/g.37849 Transcript_14338/m.37849 type:complete len:203 (-) Transcript_14338:727-1335(-)